MLLLSQLAVKEGDDDDDDDYDVDATMVPSSAATTKVSTVAAPGGRRVLWPLLQWYRPPLERPPSRTPTTPFL